MLEDNVCILRLVCTSARIAGSFRRVLLEQKSGGNLLVASHL